MKKIKAFAVFNAVCFLIQIAAAYLIQSSALGTKSVGEVSARYESLFTPAGMTFAIWGVIYTLLAMFCLYHIIIAFKHDKDHPANDDLLKIGNLFILVNLAGAAWMWVWVNEYLIASVVLIYLQLLCLGSIHRRINMYDPMRSAASKLSTMVPLSIYFGWMTIASIANSSSYLAATGWDGFGIAETKWAIILICIAVIITLVLIIGFRNYYYGLPVAWGLYGISVKRSGTGDISNDVIVIATGIAVGIILLACLVQIIRNINYKPPQQMFPATPISPEQKTPHML
jgi:hypothetical protein